MQELQVEARFYPNYENTMRWAGVNHKIQTNWKEHIQENECRVETRLFCKVFRRSKKPGRYAKKDK
tara:strand:+ start:2410 stop:2607 length:198 start_codon:yes stop_codon:yes gene_type:complete